MCEPYDAKTLLPQLFSEHSVLLAEGGFEIEEHYEEGLFATDPVIVTNAPGCMRIVDNLFSNMKKYAEPAYPVHFYVSEDASWVYLKIENKIRENTEDVESTGIGLKTCERIAKNIGMRFETKNEDDTFIVSVAIPKQKEEEK
jgi:signal transduction histidine kinase